MLPISPELGMLTVRGSAKPAVSLEAPGRDIGGHGKTPLIGAARASPPEKQN
jgi:hypothetical protein